MTRVTATSVAKGICVVAFVEMAASGADLGALEELPALEAVGDGADEGPAPDAADVAPEHAPIGAAASDEVREAAPDS